MGGLSFVSPALLFALLALPAIWFLLRATPPSPRSIVFPPFEILRRLAKSPETPHRTPWWILLLRLAIAMLAIVGLAGPILNAPPPPQIDAPLILVLDDGWAAAPGWRLRKDALQEAGEQAARSNRALYLLRTTDDNREAPTMMTGEDLVDVASSLDPTALAPDYARTIERLGLLRGVAPDAEIRWLADGVAYPQSDALGKLVSEFPLARLQIDERTPSLALHPARREGGNVKYKVSNLSGADFAGAVVAFARDGRELARAPIEPGGGDNVDADLPMPLALQNEMALARIVGVPSAGAVQLVDARERRALVGFIATGEANLDPLLAGQHYIRQALATHAQFVVDTLENLLASDVSAIILDDVGVLRQSDAESLKAWIEKGGVVIRFAGPNLTEAAEDKQPLLLPTTLRGGGRDFGGALTWETPQQLAAFAEDGPFAGLARPDDVFVRRQVLAAPGAETSERSWARLEDGTPLVSGETIGAGALVLFHVTAAPEWSDLPLSEVFIEMLRKVVFLSALGPASAASDRDLRVTAYRVLDGFGALKQPPRDFAPATLAEIASGPAPGRPPGLYGAPDAPAALNAVSSDEAFNRLQSANLTRVGYDVEPPVRIAPGLFLAALLLLLADTLVALKIAGKLPFVTALAVTLIASIAAMPTQARAQAPLDRPIEQSAVDAALDMRLAYVKTGDPATDRISEAGMIGLTRELTRRTSAEPAPPAAVDPEVDDLSVYPFIYWPVTPGAARPSDRALANIETFMRLGGLILFDTRDDERAVTGAPTPEGIALRDILGGLDLPPLAPISADHVLYRSFYLLSDLSGRMAARPVWAQIGDGPNDSLTPVIIGGRDWAGAWAVNAAGEPLLPVTLSARPCANIDGAAPRNARECANRAGVNIVMVALTGNYKSDQVHTPVLLQRLGRE